MVKLLTWHDVKIGIYYIKPPDRDLWYRVSVTLHGGPYSENGQDFGFVFEGQTHYLQESTFAHQCLWSNDNPMKPSVDIYSGGPATNEYILAIQQAIIAGRKIQYKLKVSICASWAPLITPDNSIVLNWVQYDFRVDPTDRPKKIVPLDISDFGPVTWLRGPLIQYEQMIIGIRGAWLILPERSVNNADNSWLTPMSMFNQTRNIGTHEYSTDRKTWHPTHKEVDAE